MATLADVCQEKSIVKRKKILKKFLNANEVGELSKEESKHFQNIFQDFYTPDPGDVKLEYEEILSVHISLHPKYKTKGFWLHHNQCSLVTPIPCAKDKLAGSKGSQNVIVARAARNIIDQQILEFRHKNPLAEDGECPSMEDCKGNGNLGRDCHVDHVVAFKDLLRRFCEENNARQEQIKTKYEATKYNHEFESEYESDKWWDYHKTHAKLRWLCKKCNLSG